MLCDFSWGDKNKHLFIPRWDTNSRPKTWFHLRLVSQWVYQGYLKELKGNSWKAHSRVSLPDGSEAPLERVSFSSAVTCCLLTGKGLVTFWITWALHGLLASQVLGASLLPPVGNASIRRTELYNSRPLLLTPAFFPTPSDMFPGLGGGVWYKDLIIFFYLWLSIGLYTTVRDLFSAAWPVVIICSNHRTPKKRTFS